MGNHSLTEEERVQIEGRIAALEIEHQDLGDVIERLSGNPDQDQLQLRRFKKRKLILKDSISRLKILLVPDIPA
ncbi:MAG TPA: YdcH family protein [Burkholderiales bacterium]|nr:YdcH family protein [Burkholderiales bacterium]